MRTPRAPCRLTTPYVGFTPTTPHSAAGWRIEPPVSLPKLSAENPAATAAALPPLDPPGTRLGSSGLRVGPNAEFSVLEPIANSSRFVLPTMTAPAAFEPGDDGGVVGRLPALEDLRRAGRRDAPGAHVVLERDRHPGERPGIATGGDGGVDLGGGGAGLRRRARG